MSFLKISGLFLGTSSVLGGTGAGIYYAVRKNDENAKSKFVGKLVFFKKSEDSTNTLYEMELLNESEYNQKVSEFDNGKSNDKKHAAVNKVIEISCELNLQQAKDTLKEIVSTPASLADIKAKILAKEKDLKELFGEKIYSDLQSKTQS